MKYDVPEFDLAELENTDDLCKTREIYDAIFLGIYRGVESKLENAPVFAVKNTEFVFSVEKCNYVEKIKDCINFYSSIENYEACIELQELQKRCIF